MFRFLCGRPDLNYCRFPKIAPRVRKLFLNMSFTLGEEPPLTLGEELQTARYRLYRSQILQQNMRWKALAEIYTMHSFAPVSNLNIFVKICNCFGKFWQIFADFAGVPHPGCYFLETIVAEFTMFHFFQNQFGY